MLSFAVAAHTILTNAYNLFCVILGVWALIIAIRGQSIEGSFWGAYVINSILPIAILIVTLLLQVGGLPPGGNGTYYLGSWPYYLYLAYFVVVCPGTYALLRGRDDKVAAWIYAAVLIFTALTSLSRAEQLTSYAAQLAAIKP